MTSRISSLAANAAIVAAIVAPACGGDISVFSDGTGGVGNGNTSTSSGQGGTSSSSSASSGQGGSSSSSSGQGGSSSSSSGQGGSSSSSSSSGQGGSSASSSSGQGGSPSCPHSKCDEGGPMPSSCEPCVAQICGQDQYCCTTNWDALCVAAVWSVCQIDCAPNLIGCDAQYSQGTAGYYLCAQTASICDFGFTNTQASCATVCTTHGGECIAMYNNVNQCGHSQMNYGCNYVGFQSAICVCSRGCGGGPPCSNAQTCTNGQCI